MEKFKKFIQEVKEELKKVVWPTKQETIQTTIVVIVMTLIVSAFLGVVDVALSKVIKLIVG
ncbi:preprotein translocase subunit E [Deferribacter desulfuricans SSM1]|uniref:Protein translocase subunit SecE n=1 Tax=Deferribacter desulfuricans (strain DSM 14783 / JCM 11476 / NBRC 101012 / SSM1) TaxID=639282 RepID=D3P950_DEFDS|nr:preprotein translocase subunit SecE [Deferribacter desulfuricans]BAI81240.1 preprotein translocase subunit E [Deferribacter desulfuricans SSM1]